MHGDEEDLEAASEEPEHEQHITLVAERLAERLCHRLLRSIGRRPRRARLPWRCERERQRHDEKHDGGEDDERVLPADTIDERHRERREQELPETSRPPFRRRRRASATAAALACRTRRSRW